MAAWATTAQYVVRQSLDRAVATGYIRLDRHVVSPPHDCGKNVWSGLTDTSARVSLVPKAGEAAVGPTAGAQGDLLIGTITCEWDAIKRRLLLVDSTPNHASGAISLESPSIFDDTFRIKLAMPCSALSLA